MTVELDDGDNLTKFFGCLKKYNGGKEMSQEYQRKLE